MPGRGDTYVITCHRGRAYDDLHRTGPRSGGKPAFDLGIRPADEVGSQDPAGREFDLTVSGLKGVLRLIAEVLPGDGKRIALRRGYGRYRGDIRVAVIDMDLEGLGAGGIAVKGDRDHMVADMPDLGRPHEKSGCVIDHRHALCFRARGQSRGVGAGEYKGHGGAV